MNKNKLILACSLAVSMLAMGVATNGGVKHVSAGVEKTYVLVKSISDLEDNDAVVFVSQDNNAYANGYSTSKYITNGYGSFNNDSFVASDAYELKINKNNSYYTFKNTGGGYLSTSGAKKLTFDNSGTYTWSLSFSGNNAIVASSNTNYGSIYYNSTSPRFLNYTSIQTAIQLYKAIPEDVSERYEVTYQTDGNCEIASETTSYGSVILPSCTKNGYRFDGWYNGDTKVGEAGDTYSPQGNVVLTSRWIKQYTISLYLDNNVSSFEVDENSCIDEPSASNKFGYSFGGWYTTSDFNEKFDFSAPITSDISLFGQYVETKNRITTLDFTKIDGFSSWSTSYSSHSVDFDDGSVVFASAAKQSSTINNMPVIKNGSVTFSTIEDYYIVGCELQLKQWSDKAQTVTLNVSKDSSNYTKTNFSSTNFLLTATEIGEEIKSIRFSFSNTSNQVGIQSLKLELKKIDESGNAEDEVVDTKKEYIDAYHDYFLDEKNLYGTRFIGSVNESYIDSISAIGFKFTLIQGGIETKKTTYTSSMEKMYSTIDDSKKENLLFDEDTYSKNGCLSFSLLIKEIPENFTGAIEYSAYVQIDEKTTYYTTTQQVNFVDGRYL